MQVAPGAKHGHIFKISVAFVVEHVNNSTAAEDIIGSGKTKNLDKLVRAAQHTDQKIT